MLVLSRKEGERIQAGEIEIVILKVEGSRVKVGIEAPSHINIKRGEVEDGTDTGFESAHIGGTSQAGSRR